MSLALKNLFSTAALLLLVVLGQACVSSPIFQSEVIQCWNSGQYEKTDVVFFSTKACKSYSTSNLKQNYEPE